MARGYEPIFTDSLFNELEGQNDRAAIAVAGSLVEYALERAISSHLREPTNPTESGSLFQESGIFNTFSKKILGAYFLRIIGPITRRDLDLMRQIRNQAAHDMNPISFEDTPQIKSRCAELTLPKSGENGAPITSGAKRQFITTAQFFTANLLLRASRIDAPEVKEAAGIMAPYLDR